MLSVNVTLVSICVDVLISVDFADVTDLNDQLGVECMAG